MNEQIEKMHQVQLKIALELKRICQKHDIAYFLTAGTLLGAVRHGGFIPWDDDIDIGMLRENYERFIQVCRTDLSEEFYLQTWDTDPEYPFSYAKLRLKGTHFVETFSEGTKMQDGIFVDIFPYDNAPDSLKERKRQARRYYICKRLLWIKKGFGKSMRRESVRQAVKYYGFCLPAKLIPYGFVKKYYKNVQAKYNGRLTECVVTDGAYPYSKETLSRSWVEHLEPITFETEEFLSYKERTAYLQHFYGDYTRLPPEEKRHGHKPVKIDFGKY